VRCFFVYTMPFVHFATLKPVPLLYLCTFTHYRYAQVLVQLMVAAVIDGPLHEFLGAGSAEAPSGTTIPPLDFTRATLAQRKGPVALPCKWR